MTVRDDDIDRVAELAAAAGLTVEEFLEAAAAAHARRRRRPLTLYQRLQHAGGLRRLVEGLYPRVLADPVLMRYFKHLDDADLRWLRWHMLTLLASVTGGPDRYKGRDLQAAHADLHVTGEAFERLLALIQRTLEDLEITRDDQRTVVAMVQALRSSVVTFEEP